MRLFVAVNLESHVPDIIHDWQDQFRSAAIEGNFTDKTNYHITIKFLGEVEHEQVKSICRVLQRIASKTSHFVIEPGRADVFRHPEGFLFYLDLSKGKKELYEIADFANDEFEKIGFPRDVRPFKAHITLGRRVRFSDEFRFISEDAGNVEFSSGVSGIYLMESVRERGKLVYKQKNYFPFSKGELREI